MRRAGPLAVELGEELADECVHFLRLRRRGDLAGTDGPDGLVGDHDVGDLLLGDAGEAADGLGADDVEGLAGLALLQVSPTQRIA
jgi:hypothetical protein